MFSYINSYINNIYNNIISWIFSLYYYNQKLEIEQININNKKQEQVNINDKKQEQVNININDKKQEQVNININDKKQEYDKKLNYYRNSLSCPTNLYSHNNYKIKVSKPLIINLEYRCDKCKRMIMKNYDIYCFNDKIFCSDACRTKYIKLSEIN
jgi:formylmethanofuran dehydrogenase subunit E